jgi:hypothetical protein
VLAVGTPRSLPTSLVADRYLVVVAEVAVLGLQQLHTSMQRLVAHLVLVQLVAVGQQGAVAWRRRLVQQELMVLPVHLDQVVAVVVVRSQPILPAL